MRKLGRAAGVELSAHVLRHTWVTRLVRAGNDVVLVADLAGHRKLETTRRYQDEVVAGTHQPRHAGVPERVRGELQFRSRRDAAHDQIDCSGRQPSALRPDEQRPLPVGRGSLPEPAGDCLPAGRVQRQLAVEVALP